MEETPAGKRRIGTAMAPKNTGACIHRHRSPSSTNQYSQCHSEDVATAVTVQTTSMTTNRSGSESSTSEAPRFVSSNIIVPSTSSPRGYGPNAVIIETELSNLTESPSTEGLDRASNIHRSSIGAGDQMLAASMTRLHQLELKRNVVRYQRFRLEQRLLNFRRIAFVPTRPAEADGNGEERERVVNRRYKVQSNYSTARIGASETVRDGASSRCSTSRTVLYTGCLDAEGRPQDDNAILCFDDDQRYEGSVHNGQRHGSGVNHWPDGQVYDGEWLHDSRCGMGTHTWKDGRTVTGAWKDGHLHGRVFFRWPNGAVFDGTANMGKKEGKGVWTHSDGTVYNGNYENGKESGFGTLIHPDGVKYRGHFRNGSKEGYGVMLWQTRTYDGEWSNDKPHGQGRVVWSNGAVFTGQFEHGTISGLGVYIWPSGKKFVGRWENGVKSGHGLHTWPCGKKYDGHYANGHKDGYGRMTWADGSAYCGGFKRNKRYGRGIQMDSDGSVVHCGLWKNDLPYLGSETLSKLSPILNRSTRTPLERNSHKLLAEVEVTRHGKNKNGARSSSLPNSDTMEETPLLSFSLLPAPVIVTPTEKNCRSHQLDYFRSIAKIHTADGNVSNKNLRQNDCLSSPEDRQDAAHIRSSPSLTLVSAFSERLSI